MLLQQLRIPVSVQDVQQIFQASLPHVEQYEAAVNTAVARGLLSPDDAAHLVSSMTTGSLSTVNTFHNIYAVVPPKVIEFYGIERAKLMYAIAFQRRTIAQRDIVQRILAKVEHDTPFVWESHLYEILGRASQYFLVDATVLNFQLDSWDWALDFVAKHAKTFTISMDYESIVLMLYVELGKYARSAGTTIEAALQEMPFEWFMSMVWDKSLQHGIAGITPDYVNQQCIAEKYGALVSP